MFDFTPLARAVGFTFLGYLCCVPLGAVVLAIVGSTTGDSLSLSWLWWPVPLLFALLIVVLAVDYLRRLGSGRLTSTQVTGHRVAGALMVVGSVFALGVGHWEPLAVTAVGFLVLLLPSRGKATASTWTPR
jgi:hypothetical protein